MLPQIAARILSAGVVYHLVRRSFGTRAGLLAGVALAITPVAIATDRNNTIDSTLVLSLLLAAWAFIKATETGRLRFLLLGAVLVGVGFNIKMLQAFLPLPAFYALYLLGARERLWPKLGKLALATVVLLAVSLSWAVAVDLTPADQRSYVGSSGDNSELSLILGYNGIQRLLGQGNRGSLLSGLVGNSSTGGGQPAAAPGQGPNAGGQPPQGFQPPQGQDGAGMGQPPSGPVGNNGFMQGGPGGGPFNTGQPGCSG